MPPKAPIAGIQALRALAALSVVFAHGQHDALIIATRLGIEFERVLALPWGAGVDLFFVISGFIMVHASAGLFGQKGAAGIFLRRRLIRIVPLYWLLASLYLLLSRGLGGASAPLPLYAGDLVAAYLFWPMDSFGDGVPRPFFTLGWTLNYEMFFYLVFAAFLAWPRALAIGAMAGLFAVLVVAGTAFGQLPVPLRFWSQPIILEFVLGMLIALGFQAGWRLGGLSRAGLLALALALLLFDPMQAATQPADWITPNNGARLLFWGLPAAMIVLACLPGADAKLPAWLAEPFSRLGDASYALYLVHPFVIVGLRKLWLALGLATPLGFWPLVGVSMIGAILAALILHHRIEKPMQAWLLTRWRAKAAPQPSFPSAGNASSR